MIHRCRVKGCAFATRSLPWRNLRYVCPFHRHDLDDDLFRVHATTRGTR